MTLSKPISRLLASVFLFLGAFPVFAASAGGPTVHLASGADSNVSTPVTDFMYFVALIAPAPVFIGSSPGSAQIARLLSTAHKSTKSSFTTTSEFQFSGAGLQESVFDLSPETRKREGALKSGGVLPRQLESIVVNGGGIVTVEARGAISNEVRTVNEVRIKFNAHGQDSFVSITLCDVRMAGGNFVTTNEIVAKVNSLTFRREPGIPKMEISVASLKDKDAGDGLWQSLKGRVAGAAVNLFIPPMEVQPIGNTTMLDFGLTLDRGDSAFVFPQAQGLLAKPAPNISSLPVSP